MKEALKQVALEVVKGAANEGGTQAVNAAIGQPLQLVGAAAEAGCQLTPLALLNMGLGVANLAVGATGLGVGIFNAYQVLKIKKGLGVLQLQTASIGVKMQAELGNVAAQVQSVGADVSRLSMQLEGLVIAEGAQTRIAISEMKHHLDLRLDRVDQLLVWVGKSVAEKHDALSQQIAELQEDIHALHRLAEEDELQCSMLRVATTYRDVLFQLPSGEGSAHECQELQRVAKDLAVLALSRLNRYKPGDLCRGPLMVARVYALVTEVDARILGEMQTKSANFADGLVPVQSSQRRLCVQKLADLARELEKEAHALLQSQACSPYALAVDVAPVLSRYALLHRSIEAKQGSGGPIVLELQEASLIAGEPQVAVRWDDGLDSMRVLCSALASGESGDGSEWLEVRTVADAMWFAELLGRRVEECLFADVHRIRRRVLLDALGVPETLGDGSKLDGTGLNALKAFSVLRLRKTTEAAVNAAFGSLETPLVMPAWTEVLEVIGKDGDSGLHGTAIAEGMGVQGDVLLSCGEKSKGDKSDEYYKLARQRESTGDQARAVQHNILEAEHGNPKAELELGMRYLVGIGVAVDFKLAFKWFERAATQGDAGAQFMLARCYELGNGTKLDVATASQWYARAVDGWGLRDLGPWFSLNPKAGLAKALQLDRFRPMLAQKIFGLAVPASMYGGIRAYGALASLSVSVGALRGLASLDLKRCEALASLPEAVTVLMVKGDARTQFSLGCSYASDTGVEKDEARAAELYSKAAERGDAAAQCFLGMCYARSRGVDKDGAKAVKWMRTAAQQGDPGIKANLAEYLMEGLGGAPNWVEALQLFQSSLVSKAPSKVTSAWMLYGGQNGVQRDKLKARTMCEEVLTTEDLEDQLESWEAVGWTWPAALEWFRSEVWRTDEPSGEALERGEGERGSLRKAEGNGRGTPAHLEKGALAGASRRGDSAEEKGESHRGGAAVRASAGLPREALGPGSRPKLATLRRFSRVAIIVSVIVAIIAIAVAVNQKQVRDT
ncbi:hypothetical protein KFL_002950020 [Klebsormidium nitens]|uniref:Uncharacterized protein n=1 Tax=Klebsormidium nitens TaxID=105231 RepID=A0A1Y1I6F0_KLENI|nr:hypothetical protein KFL_002950020 [Klebsormidium nitens]|eukprot:GAQ86530.1 hypothetical protein KFL_002950020 [Klebsormidium nitens]